MNFDLACRCQKASWLLDDIKKVIQLLLSVLPLPSHHQSELAKKKVSVQSLHGGGAVGECFRQCVSRSSTGTSTVAVSELTRGWNWTRGSH